MLTSPAGSSNHVGKRSFGLLPATSLQAAIRVDEQMIRPDQRQHVRDTVLDLLLAGNTRRVDIVNTRTDEVLVSELLESGKELHVALRRFDGDDVGVQTFDRGEDVVEVGVAEV